MKDPQEKLEQWLGYKFKNRDLFARALTHSSCVREGADTSNERLEFVGDSLLGAIVSCFLYENFPDWTEGELTRAKAALVNETSLAELARHAGIGEALLLSRGEEQGGGRDRASILCGAFEALFAALYYDADLENTRDFYLKWLAEPLSKIAPEDCDRDYKTVLQETIQEEHHRLPVYTVVDERGPDHDKTFVVEVRLDSELLGIGTGKSKKEAAQAAAEQALQKCNHGHCAECAHGHETAMKALE
jgi:ribonuclease III